MIVVIKNTSVSSVVVADTGETIPALGQITISHGNYYLWADSVGSSGSAFPLINAGTLVVNDGVTDLSAARGLDYLNSMGTHAFGVRFLSEAERANGITSKTVQEAIEEVKSASGRGYAASAGFDGTASTGRYLEFNSNVDSNMSGFVVPLAATLKEISVAVISNATVTFQIQNKAGTVLTSVVMTAQRTKTITGLSIALTAGLELMVYTSSGSGARPIVNLFIQ